MNIQKENIIYILNVNRAAIYSQLSRLVCITIKNIIRDFYKNHHNYTLTKHQWKRIKYIVKNWSESQGVYLTLNNW